MQSNMGLSEHVQATPQVEDLQTSRAFLDHQLRELRGERDQAITDRGEIIQETGVLKNTIEYLNTQINERTMERNAFRDSLEHRIGEFLIKRFHCRPWLRGLELMTVTIQRHLAIWGLTFARWASEWRGRHSVRTVHLAIQS